MTGGGNTLVARMSENSILDVAAGWVNGEDQGNYLSMRGEGKQEQNTETQVGAPPTRAGGKLFFLKKEDISDDLERNASSCESMCR